jgi:drug/metabolite transporter (DMT)-like permease
MMYYVSISIAVLSTALYHFSQRATPRGINPPLALLATYAVAMVLTAILLWIMPAEDGIIPELRKLNWASYLLGVSIVGLEVGFLLAYRAGWNLGLAAVLVNVAASLVLVPIALLAFKDQLSWVNIAGVLTCLAGLIMLNWRH